MPLVRGIQLGVGLKLAIRGVGMVIYKSAGERDWRQWWGTEGLLLGIFGFVFIAISALPQKESCPKGSDSPLADTAEVSDASLMERGSDSQKPLREGSRDTESTTEGEESQDIESLDTTPSPAAALPTKDHCSSATSRWPPPCCGSSKNGRRIQQH